MQIKYLILIVLCIQNVWGQRDTCPERQNATITFSSNLKCGHCIKGGYNYCFQGAEGQLLEIGTEPNGTCCQDSTCSQFSDPAWNCSMAYADQDLAVSFCPIKKSQCGPSNLYQFGNIVNYTENITIKGLAKGEVCHFKINSTKGGPGFKFDNKSRVDLNKINITYIEYNQQFMNQSGTLQNQRDSSKSKNRSSQPDQGKPRFDSNFSFACNQSQNDKQIGPPRKKNDGSLTNGTTVDDRKQQKKDYYSKAQQNGQNGQSQGGQNSQMQGGQGNQQQGGQGGQMQGGQMQGGQGNQRQGGQGGQGNQGRQGNQMNGQQNNQGQNGGQGGSGGQGGNKQKQLMSSNGSSSDSNSTAIYGYGLPTIGRYNASKGGFKSFGTVGQGQNNLAVKNDSIDSTTSSTMLIQITAVNDMAPDESIMINAGNYQFLDDLVQQEVFYAPTQASQTANYFKILFSLSLVSAITLGI